jgi:hypothetical protein
MATGTSPSAVASTQRNIEIDEVRIPEPLWSVGSRVSWGALVAGGVVALAIYILLSLLGVAIGVTVSDRFSPEQLGKMAAFYTFAALMVCMFVGGWVSTRCTAGEFRSEAVLYGVIVWAITSSLLIPLTAIGVGTGVSTVLAAHGIAKVKTEVLPAVASAKDMAKQNVDSAKNQLASVEDRVKQAANGERSDEGRSDRDGNSTAKGDVSNDSSADGKSTSNASGSQERQSNSSRESDSSNESRESSNDSDRASRDESTDNNSRVPHQTREEFKAASWWAFGGSFVSLIAAMLGAIAGPTISVVRHEIPVGRSANARAKVSRP